MRDIAYWNCFFLCCKCSLGLPGISDEYIGKPGQGGGIGIAASGVKKSKLCLPKSFGFADALS